MLIKHKPMKPFIAFVGITICVGSFITPATAQDSKADLQTRVDSLERRVGRIEFSLKSKENAPRSQTRSNMEKGELSGIVISDNQGISLKIGGFVQIDGIHDLEQNTSGLGFLSSGIVIPNDKKANTLYNVGASRFNLSGSMLVNQKELTTFIEFDMFNQAFVPVLRNAWAEYGGFGAGLYWSNFMDLDAYPNTLDYNGPNAMIFARQVQFRYTWSIDSALDWAFSLEDPRSYMTLDSGFRTLKQFPDVTTSLQYDWDNSHVRVAGVLHPLAYGDVNQERSHSMGYGISLSTLLQQNRNKDNFTCQFNYGTGISKYYNDLAGGYPYDGIYSTADKKLKPIAILGISASYDHWWTDKLSSTIGYGYMNINNRPEQDDADIHSTQYAIINFIYYPNEFIKSGIEWIYGTRQNIDGAHAYNNRAQFTVQLAF